MPENILDRFRPLHPQPAGVFTGLLPETQTRSGRRGVYHAKRRSRNSDSPYCSWDATSIGCAQTGTGKTAAFYPPHPAISHPAKNGRSFGRKAAGSSSWRRRGSLRRRSRQRRHLRTAPARHPRGHLRRRSGQKSAGPGMEPGDRYPRGHARTDCSTSSSRVT